MPSLGANPIDHLPANYVLRIFVMALAITALFVISYLPWFLMDRRAKQGKDAENVENARKERTEAAVK